MSVLVNFGEVGLVDRRGLLELPEVAVERLLFLPWLAFSVHPGCGVGVLGVRC